MVCIVCLISVCEFSQHFYDKVQGFVSSVCVWGVGGVVGEGCAHECMSVEVRRGCQSLRAGVTGHCELPSIGAGNKTQVFCKRSPCS